MNSAPVYLFADSEPLFKTAMAIEQPDSKKAAYVGFANKDKTEFYQIFQAVMHNNGINNTRQITLDYSPEEKAFLSEADYILLAGGDVEFGLKALVEREIDLLIAKKYVEGCKLIGISAGAVHLGQNFYSKNGIYSCLKILPVNIDVHNEKNDWKNLRSCVLNTGVIMAGIGLPIHGGLIYHEDNSLEALYKPVYEFRNSNGNLLTNIIMPHNGKL